MAFRDDYDFTTLVNEKEHWVIDELEKQLKDRPEVCDCSECVLDMTALTLNQTKPNYRVTLMGAIFAMAEDEKTADEIRAAVTKSINQVNENPACERRHR